MKRQSVSTLILGAAMLVAFSAPSYGITFDLNCVLSSSACTLFPQSFGTVQITDIGGNTGVNVTVTTTLGGKTKDLFLNIDSSLPAPTLTSPAIFSSDAFSLSPYNGLFDVGTSITPSAGFDSASGVTFQILGNINADYFKALDSLNLVGVGIHLQEINCNTLTCTSGGNSIKVGGTLVSLPPPGGDDPGVPEPGTYAIVGGGLAVLGWMRRNRS